MLCPSCNRIVNGSKCLCGWRSSIVEAARPTAEAVPHGAYITKEQFGLPLYQAIQCYTQQAALKRQRQTLLTNLSLPVEIKKRQLADICTQLDQLTQQIMACMPHILPGDIQRLLRTYETHSTGVAV